MPDLLAELSHMSVFKAYAFPIHWEYRFKPIISSLQTKPETRMYVYLPNTFVGVTWSNLLN